MKEEQEKLILFESIIGMSIEDAKKFVESISYSGTTYYIMRIVKKDGKNLMTTMDCRCYRLNVETVDNKISKLESIG